MKDRRFNNIDKINMAVWILLMVLLICIAGYFAFGLFNLVEWLIDV